MTRVLVNGVRLNIEVVGEGPAIVAIHGFTGSVDTWESFVRNALNDYTVVAVDLLGHGASDAPSDPARYRMERCVEDLEALLDHLGLERVHWLGYSLGGRIALSAAVALPQRTATLVVESASPGLDTPEERAARACQDEALAAWIESVGVERFVAYWEGLPLFASQRRLPAAVGAGLRAHRLRNTSLGLANSLRGVGVGVQPPVHHKLATVERPALFIAGEEDAKFVAIAREMHSLAPRGCLCIIPGAGHAVHLERPEQFNKVVLDFLADHREAGAPSLANLTGSRPDP